MENRKPNIEYRLLSLAESVAEGMIDCQKVKEDMLLASKLTSEWREQMYEDSKAIEVLRRQKKQLEYDARETQKVVDELQHKLKLTERAVDDCRERCRELKSTARIRSNSAQINYRKFLKMRDHFAKVIEEHKTHMEALFEIADLVQEFKGEGTTITLRELGDATVDVFERKLSTVYKCERCGGRKAYETPGGFFCETCNSVKDDEGV